jgi:hypothetical protein
MSFPQPSDYRPPIIPDGEVYDNPENGRSYYWTQIVRPDGSTGGYWTVVCESGDGRFVLKAGDTMTGTLEIANEGDTTDVDFDPDKANLTFTTTKTDGSDSSSVSIHQNGYNSSIGITGGVIADGSYFSQSGKYYGADPSGQYFSAWSPRLQLEELEGKLQWDDSARVQWNEFNVEIPKPVEDDQDSDGLIIRGTTANGYETTDPDDQDGKLLAVYHNADTADAVNYRGKINAANNLVNKGYVDEKDELLRQDIIELEEEIDAIAPSLEYGNWEWVQPPSNARAPEKGTFYLLDGLGQLTTEYKDTAIVVINNYEYDDPNDNDPVDIHTWADADVGELIQLFDAADPDFMLGKITDVAPATESTSSGTLEFVRITIDLIQSSGVPNDNLDPVTGKYLSRVNIFKEPSGGNASDFVLKSGDTMEGPGPLMFKTAKTTYNSSSPGSGTAYVKFQNKYGSGTGVHEVNMFMGGGSSSSNGLCITGRPLHVSNTIYSSGQYKARSSSEEYKPSLYFASEEGQLRYNGYTKLTWKSDGIREMIIKSNDGDKGMVIKRDRSTTNRVEWSGVVDIDTSGTNRCIGELWYNKNDGVMYLRIS